MTKLQTFAQCAQNRLRLGARADRNSIGTSSDRSMLRLVQCLLVWPNVGRTFVRLKLEFAALLVLFLGGIAFVSWRVLRNILG